MQSDAVGLCIGESGQLDVARYQREMVSVQFERVIFCDACLNVNRVDSRGRKLSNKVR